MLKSSFRGTLPVCQPNRNNNTWLIVMYINVVVSILMAKILLLLAFRLVPSAIFQFIYELLVCQPFNTHG